MDIISNTTIAEIQNMQLNEQIEALSSIWDQIAFKNPGFDVSKEDKRLLDERVLREEDIPSKPWENLKKSLLKKQKETSPCSNQAGRRTGHCSSGRLLQSQKRKSWF